MYRSTLLLAFILILLVGLMGCGSGSGSGSGDTSETGGTTGISDPSATDPGDTGGGTPTPAIARDIIRVSVSSDGAGGEIYGAGCSSISGDGSFATFYSGAVNLVPDDTNGWFDTFVRDIDASTTTIVSRSSDGTQGYLYSLDSSISGDGRYVAFQSRAYNLVADDTNDLFDIFVHDRVTGETTRVSVDSQGRQAYGGDSELPEMSYDGRYVLFESSATNLIPSDHNGSERDVFIHDRETGETTIASVSTEGHQSIATDGAGTRQ